ncbi:hypothetical protein P7K49_022356 [Saguinus oedipus]|uniref:Uncharacterized protein n=1 Tax=Saguinus oedipus TaxID=9490 RepID=A0ABQ9UVB2_SAGOE|nr:hypothetical protein P7K49_022356 [Saguinus oedipus]
MGPKANAKGVWAGGETVHRSLPDPSWAQAWPHDSEQASGLPLCPGSRELEMELHQKTPGAKPREVHTASHQQTASGEDSVHQPQRHEALGGLDSKADLELLAGS